MLTCIDFHTHIFPDHVAEKVIRGLEETYRAQSQGPATVAGLAAAMDKASVDRAVLCPVATRPDQVRGINRWIASLDRQRFLPFGALHPDCPDLEEELAFLRDQDLRGVKLQPYFQGYELQAPAALKMMEKLAEFVVLIHGGQEISPISSVPTTPERLRMLHQRFPDHRLVIAHLGGYQMWQEVEEYLVGEDVYFDLSYTFDRLDDESIARLIAAHGPQRILFGSDYPWQLPAVSRAGLARLHLSLKQEKRILAGNAVELLAL